MDEFKTLYDKAFNASKETFKNEVCEIGSVGCALLNENGHIYVGKNLDMSCSLGMCAERNAISSMLTYETCRILKLVCVHKSGKIIMPCGACREFMKQLGPICKDVQILINLNPIQFINLDKTIPNWWAKEVK